MKRIVLISVIVVFISFKIVPRSKNNVCKTFSDYYGNRDKNKNCYYNPEMYLNVSEVIERRGYPVEEHQIVTKDGYILTTFRIPYGKNNIYKGTRHPIFIQHGALMNSACFVNRGNKSLAFILADAGYDVWLGNFRGTTYSRKHINLTDESKEYWDFDTYELSVFDVAANVDLIYNVTKLKVLYLGYSFGSSAGYIYSATYPKIAVEKTKFIIGMAPAVYLKNWISASKYLIPLWLYAQSFALKLTKGEVYIRGKPPSTFKEGLCLPYPIQMYICQFFDMLVSGFDYEQNDPETLPITLLQNADATSYRTISHGLQLIQKGNFDYYDYGPAMNQIKYGTPEVPQHDLSKIPVPTYLIYGKNDWMTSKENSHMTYNIFKQLKVDVYGIYEIKHDPFNHQDFVVARDVVPLVYEPLVSFINTLYVE
ncbi:hypothetical protein FQA39_LY14476 [Lamprigera yunnana]|nr:hypothetical protein FQA39_LY14476 [Lamprigera yunnana]